MTLSDIQWDWELITTWVKTVATLIGIAVAGYQSYKLGIKGIQSRLALKRDIEVLKMLPPTDPGHALVKAHVDRLIQRLYKPPSPPLQIRLAFLKPKKWKDLASGGLVFLKPKKWEDLASGGLVFLGFSVWTAYLDRHGFSWWSLLTGIFALSGLSVVFEAYGLSPDSREKSKA